eukprot:scaffold78274_cov18-Tisochrysis_lutea.AAC.1
MLKMVRRVVRGINRHKACGKAMKRVGGTRESKFGGLNTHVTIKDDRCKEKSAQEECGSPHG